MYQIMQKRASLLSSVSIFQLLYSHRLPLLIHTYLKLSQDFSLINSIWVKIKNIKLYESWNNWQSIPGNHTVNSFNYYYYIYHQKFTFVKIFIISEALLGDLPVLIYLHERRCISIQYQLCQIENPKGQQVQDHYL
jgi:hypothetical protein